MNSPGFNKICSRASVLFLFLGAALRTILWWQDRSLFIDEANLVRNFLEKPFPALFGPLDYQQYAPPIFSILEKTMLSVFGPAERVGRFLPLVFGLGSLPLAWSMGRRWLSPVGLALFCLFFALDGPFVQFSSEAKQYSADCFAALLLLEAAQRFDFQRFRWTWAIGGAAIVWFSMPAVFILAAIGFWWLFGKKTGISWRERWRDRWREAAPRASRDRWREAAPRASHFVGCADRSRLLKMSLIFATWLVSFAAYYLLFLKQNIANPTLQSAHIFLPFPPKNGGDWAVWLRTFNGFSNWLIGFTVVAHVCFYVGLLAGAWFFIKRKPGSAALVWLPPAFVFAASAMGQYSMVERLLLFVMPCVLLWVVIGWDFLFISAEKMAGKNTHMAWLAPFVLLAAILISAAGQLKYDWFYRPFQIEEHRAALDFFAKNRQPDDVLFVHHNAAPTVGHSTRFSPEKYPFGEKFVRLQNWQPEAGFLQKEVRNWQEAHQTGRIFVQWPGEMSDAERLFFGEKTKLETVFTYQGGHIFVVPF